MTAAVAVALTALVVASAPSTQPERAQGIPARLSDEQFWNMVTEFSEPDGFFRSDNFVSNEVTFQYVIPELVQGRSPGGVYVGVGPDQNFTYIVALRPRISFIVDIRRGAMLQHLMYKTLIEMAKDRADFLSLLFSRPRPPNLDAHSTAEDLFQAMYLVAQDSGMYWRTLQAIKDRLTKVHGFTLGEPDFAGIEYVFTSFYLAGPDITYNYGSGRGFSGRGMPSYAQLMLENDGQGLNRSYLATEENFRVLKDLHGNNLIVPLVGDFAGPKALRAVGQYLREAGATVTAVYTSNVEQYLFQSPDNWRRYYENLATVPADSMSTFVRAVFNFPGYRPSSAYGPRSMTLLYPIGDLLRAYAEGRIMTYQDVVMMSR